MEGKNKETKKNLFVTIHSMDNNSNYRSFYAFAYKYTMGMKRRKVSSTEEFIEAIRYCMNNPNNTTVKRIMGISRKSDDTGIAEWCKYLLINFDKDDDGNKVRLENYDLKSLIYIFGCCAHIATVNG